MKDYFKAGTVLCDTHYGFSKLTPELEVVSSVEIMTNNGSEIAEQLIEEQTDVPYMYTNKLLVSLGADLDKIKAVYSYDGRRMGFVTLRVRSNNDSK